MSYFQPAPTPKTPLGRYRQLAPRASVAVSPLCLGGMSIGDAWSKHSFGDMDKETSFALLDAFYQAGGNFIDTANSYQEQTSEQFIGEWMEARGVREQMVIATKYSTNYYQGQGYEDVPIQANFIGNHVKSMRHSVDASLKKLRTNFIDILYVHWWDYLTSIEEVMDGLHNLVIQGKVLYLGVSDTPAWVVSQANQYARDHGKTPFVIYQGQWNVMSRECERDIIPMTRTHGMALAPFRVLASGKIRSDAEEERRRQTGEKGRMSLDPSWERNENERRVCGVLEAIAKDVGTPHISAVAIAYVMQKTPYVFPIIGGRTPEQLYANIEALNISLTSEHIKRIEDTTPLETVFPATFIGDGTDIPGAFKRVAQFDKQPLPQPIRPPVQKAA